MEKNLIFHSNYYSELLGSIGNNTLSFFYDYYFCLLVFHRSNRINFGGKKNNKYHSLSLRRILSQGENLAWKFMNSFQGQD